MAVTKGERTRQRVVERAAPIFNQRGYWGSSLSNLMQATGLEKGGIYNHFASKDALAEAAFDHNTDVVRRLIRGGLEGRRHAVDRLVAIIDVYREFARRPPLPGGCPMLNTAVEADDTHPALRRRVQAVMGELVDGTVARIVERGVERKEIEAGTDPSAVASVVVSAIEGALMLTNLYGDHVHMDRVADHLDRYVRSLGTGRTRP